MKTFITSLKRQSGFTLVELMVVVAIIGLLSAVAVPNFKKYQAKAKISEAKLQLSALYTAEASFFSDFNMYAKCLRYMGFDPAKETGNRYYGVGFSDGANAIDATAYAAAQNSGMQTADCPSAAASTADISATAAGANTVDWYKAGKGIGANLIDGVAKAKLNNAGKTSPAACTETGIGAVAGIGTCIGTQATAENMVYQASAVGFISGDFTTAETASGLTINHNKIFKSTVNGY